MHGTDNSLTCGQSLNGNRKTLDNHLLSELNIGLLAQWTSRRVFICDWFYINFVTACKDFVHRQTLYMLFIMFYHKAHGDMFIWTYFHGTEASTGCSSHRNDCLSCVVLGVVKCISVKAIENISYQNDATADPETVFLCRTVMKGCVLCSKNSYEWEREQCMLFTRTRVLLPPDRWSLLFISCNQ